MQIRSRVTDANLIAAGLALACGVLSAQEIGWFSYGRDTEGTRYFPVAEITRDNVGRLELAWTYRTGESEPRRPHLRRLREPRRQDVVFARERIAASFRSKSSSRRRCPQACFRSW